MILDRHPCAVDVHLLPRLPISGAHADDIAFIRHDIDQFVLAKEATQHRTSFVLLLSHLDGEGDEVIAGKSETGDDMRDGRTSPVHADQVGRLQLVEVERLVVVPRGEFSLGAIVEVADVPDLDEVAVHGGDGKHGDLRCPLAVVGCGNRVVPDDEHRKDDEEGEKGPPPTLQKRE